MTVAVGTKLGPYEILAPIGKGGMGEVWKAHDTRLCRDVAIKISAEQFTERFEHEARAIAALNHPNICHLYDVGPNYLVMELVEGLTLADRIKEGAIPLDEALAIARQIADALEAAHEKGITHRDLKPGNIKIKPDGTVKVLDFGLAKMGGTPTAHADESPTLTIGQTEAGVILGTASYMSPEQAKGKPVNQRADIYAFGAVLYEMVTGQRLHRGETTTDVLASVIKEEPQWDKVPAQVQKLLRRCLEKDLQKRLRHIGDVMALVEDVPTAPAPIVKAWPASRKWPWVAAGLAVLLMGGAAAWFLRPAPEQPMLQFDILPPEGAKFVNTLSPLALSPDGKRIVFLATNKNGKEMLWERSIDSGAEAAIPGTENAGDPFWSPDSRWVGFYAPGTLQRVDVVAGGQPQVICYCEARSGSCNSDGTIVFGQPPNLARVSAAGGTPTTISPLSRGPGVNYSAAQFLPDGRHVLYYRLGPKGPDARLTSLDGKMDRVLVEGGGVPTYAPNPRGGGWILHDVRGQLLAQPFDVKRLEFTGEPAVLAENVGIGRWWSTSVTGLLAFRRIYSEQRQLTWFSRDGRMLGTVGDPALLAAPRISPDQKTIAFQGTGEQNTNIWMFDLARNISAQFTFQPGFGATPIWSRDGKTIVYTRGNEQVLVERPANGVGPEKVLADETGKEVFPTDISRDGRWLVLTEPRAVNGTIVLRSLEDTRKTIRIEERNTERDGSISPDGRWLLYSSVPSARREVLVQSMPKEAGGRASAVGKWQISMAGGSQPTWRADGKEIFFIASDGKMMVVPVESGEDFFRAGTPQPLFQTRLEFDQRTYYNVYREYDITPDGQRFLVNQRLPDTGESPITVIVNWPKLLEKGTGR